MIVAKVQYINSFTQYPWLKIYVDFITKNDSDQKRKLREVYVKT